MPIPSRPRRSAQRLCALSLVATMLSAGAALAEPRVSASMAPVHSLVAEVMGDVGAPQLLIPLNASVHSYALTPSQATELAEAEIVFWLGEAFEPGVAPTILAISGDATLVPLGEAPGVGHLPSRRRGAHAHEEHDEHADHDDHEEHADHEDHEEHADHEDHEEHADHDDHDHHDHGMTDPHLWLDPHNAKLWLDVIAATLAEADPANAEVYFANAAAAKAEIEAAEAEIAAELAPLAGRGYIVGHDAMQYFEVRFGVEAVGFLPHDPGPRDIIEQIAAARSSGARCVVTSASGATPIADRIAEEAGIRRIDIDPVGRRQTPGADLYPAVLRGVGASLAACLADD